MTLLIALASLLPFQDGGRIVWRRDVEESLREAKEKGAPSMLYFTSEG